MIIDFALILESLPRLLAGVRITLMLFVTSLVAGTILALVIVIMRLSGVRVLSWAAFAYTYFFRSTPVLVQIFVIYFGAPQFEFIRDTQLWVLFREPVFCLWLALSLNVAAKVAEVFRAGFIAIPKGLMEAASALGLNRRNRLAYITSPLVIRLSLPAYSNEMVSAIKATSLASTVTLLDITGIARTIVSETFKPYEIFLSAALFYILMTWIIQVSVGRLERHLNRNL